MWASSKRVINRSSCPSCISEKKIVDLRDPTRCTGIAAGNIKHPLMKKEASKPCKLTSGECSVWKKSHYNCSSFVSSCKASKTKAGSTNATPTTWSAGISSTSAHCFHTPAKSQGCLLPGLCCRVAFEKLSQCL